MELTDRTLQVLKNYSAINQNIVIDDGSTLKTVSVARNIFSKSNVTEEFPRRFGIYDLNEFLGVLSLVDSPNLKFEDNYVIVSDSSGRSSIKYHYSDPDMLTSPSKDIVMPETEVKFVLDTDTMSRIKRASSTLGHDHICIRPSNGAISIEVVDNEDSTSNAFSITVDGSYQEGSDFNFVLNVNNLRTINEDFEVGISQKLISQFKSQQSDIEYYIALEKTSTYGE